MLRVEGLFKGFVNMSPRANANPERCPPTLNNHTGQHPF